jgi:hypothetical protein
MELNGIFTDRHYQNWPSWHIVYEWEDELSHALHLPMKNSPEGSKYTLCRAFKRVDHKIFNGRIGCMITDLVHKDKDCYLYFEMCAKQYKSFSNSRRTIPVIIDFWDKEGVEHFKKLYADCPYILVTSLEVFDFLKANQIKNNLVHFPMTLPSMYRLSPNQSLDKKVDIILAGRKNPVLWDFLKQFEITHPEVEYLHQIQKNGELYYESNKRGIVGKFHTRSEYMNLLKTAKVAFYATPGMDGGERRTGGFNPVTPRFFELLSGSCHIMARYPKTAETDYYRLAEICPSITTYDAFESQLNHALKSPSPTDKNAAYLKDFYTSTNIEILKKII